MARAAVTPSSPSAAADRKAADKNRPLVDDIRLLGRILGDVIREQEGKAAFELVERVRQLSVAYRLKSDAPAGRYRVVVTAGPRRAALAAVRPWCSGGLRVNE